MPRRPRQQEAGATYHVTAHAVDGAALVRDDEDRKQLLDLAGRTVTQYRWDCLALCMMDTHYHLLVTTPQPNLAAGMQFLNGRYAQLFNRRYGRRGHLFRERYWEGRVVADGHLIVTLRYIALNPVTVDLAQHATDYRWSSYPGVVGAAPCWSFVAKAKILELFGPLPEAVDCLRALVEDGVGSARRAA